MAAAFNLTAQLNLKGPSNIGSITSSIKKQLGTITANVDLKVNAASIQKISQLNAGLQQLNKTLSATTVSATSAASAIKGLGQAFGAVNLSSLPQQISATSAALGQVKAQSSQATKALADSTTQMEEFGKQSALAVRRFAAFSIVTSSIYALSNSINKGIEAFIEYDQQFVKLQQVTGQSAEGLKSLSKEITSLSVGLGVSSAALTDVASTLAQAGLNAKDTEKALKALALSSLAPSFDSMNETVEGSIALMRQFGISADGLEAALSSINTVAAKFAVEASDIITAVQRTGGVFATASKGVSEGTDALNEFIAVFTSIRATTRESAETIATGLRTIFTRIQRGSTIDALKEFGVNLQDAEGKFVGAYKAVELLSKGLNTLDPRDVKFSKIVEELGGFRQIGKVIPLIQQFSVAQNALKIAQQGQGSLAKDAATAQLSLANQIQKVRQEFLALFREMGQSQGFQVMVKATLSLASALIKVADASKGLLPLLGVMLAFKGASAITQFASGFGQGLKPGAGKKGQEKPLFSRGGPVRAFASGGVVPGSGDGDTVPAMLTPGEFVIRKKAVQAIGAQNLHKMNKYASGGIVDYIGGASGGTTVINSNKQNVGFEQDTYSINAKPERLKVSYRSNSYIANGKNINKKQVNRLFTNNTDSATAWEEIVADAYGGQIENSADPNFPVDVTKGNSLLIDAKFKEDYTYTDKEALGKALNFRLSKANTAYKYSGVPKQTIRLDSLLKQKLKPNKDDIIDTGRMLMVYPEVENIPTNLSSIRKGLEQRENESVYASGTRKKIAQQAVDAYGQDSVSGDKSIFNLLSQYDSRPQKKSYGGIIQKFLKGGTVEETAQLENLSLQDAILAQIKELGGIGGVKKLIGTSGSDRTLDSLLRANVIKQKDAIDPKALKAVNDALSNEEGKKIRRAQDINKSQKLAVVGLQPFDKSEEIPFDIPGFESSTIFVRGLSSKYAEAVAGMRQMVENTIEKFGTDIQSTMVFGGNAPLALDFDETLVSGADIFGPNGKPDIPAYSDLDKVAKALNGDKVKLTPLGEKIKEIASFDPSFLNRIRVLTARPQNNADLLSQKLNELGIPLGADKITGVSGGNKGAAMGMTERLIDDNIKNINDAKRAGKSAVQYAELRRLSEEEKAATGNANAEGAILEAALAKMGSVGGSVQNRAVDFENGLGMAAAQAFPGIAPDWPTEVKRTLSSDNIGRAKEEFKRYYTETYGPWPQQEDAFGFDKAGMPVSRFAMGGKASRKVAYEAGVGPSPFGGSISKRLGQSVYGLQKGTGLSDQEFNEIKKTADTYGYNEQEFKEYLAKRIQEKKNKSGQRTDASELLRQLSPQGRTSTQRQLALAEQLKGEPDAGYRPILTQAQRIGQSRSDLRGAIGYAVGGVAEAEQKKEKQYGKISISEDGTMVSAGYLKNDSREGYATAYKMRDNLYYVGLSSATSGYGPRLYDILMEAVTEKGAMLTSDRSMVSGDAKKVWEYYFNNRGDVKKTPLKPSDWTRNESLLDPKLYGREETWPPATDPAWILQSGYSKNPNLINDKDVIRNNNKLDSRAVEASFFATRKPFASGGSVDDTVPALLTPGEFVINKQAAQRIGYSKLHQLNHADKIAGYNKGGMVGGVQGYASGGSVTVNSAIEDLMDYLAKGMRATSAANPPKLVTRPDTPSRATLQVSDQTAQTVKIISQELNNLGVSVSNVAELMKIGGDISYKAMEKAIKKDIERMTITGASVEQISKAESALAAVRAESSDRVKKTQTLENGFRNSNIGQKLGSGGAQQQIIAESAKIEKSIQAQKIKDISSTLQMPGATPEEVKKRATELANTSEEKAKTKELAYLSAAQKVTGVKKSDFQAAGISGGDIQKYANESLRDRKTLADMDKQLIASKMQELQSSQKYKAASNAEQSRMLADAKKAAQEEVSIRREMINDLARTKGEKGVGAGGFTDTRNSPIYQTIKRNMPKTFGQGIGMATATGAVIGGLASTYGDTIAGGFYNTSTDAGKLKAAKTGAAISSTGTIASTGLGVAAQSLTVDPTGTSAAVIALGTAVVAATDYFYDFTGSQEKAAREVEKALRAKEINAATASLDDAFKKFENDMSNVDLQEALSKALSNAVMTQAKDTSANINDAKRDYAYQNRSWGDLLSLNFKGSAQMDAKQLAEVNRAEAEKFAPFAEKGYQQIQAQINSGASIEQIMSNDKLGGAREAIAMSTPEGISEYTAAKAAEEKATGKPITENARKAIIDEIAARKISTNEFVVASIKAKQVADALEAANLAGRKLAQSFQRMYDSIDQAINKNNFNIQQRKTSIDYSTGALSGNAVTPELNSKNINILDNPKVYSSKEFEGAIGVATQSLPAEDAKMIKGAATLQRNLAPAIEAELRKTLSTDAGLSADKAAEKAKEIGTAEVKNLGLPKEMEETIINQLAASIEAKTKDKNVQQEFANGPKAATDKFIGSLREASDTIIENAGKGGIETLKKLLTARQDIFNDFTKNLAKSSAFLKQYSDALIKAKNIVGDAKMNLREALTGVGETFAEAKTRFDAEISDLTGGTTDPKAISANIENLQNRGKDLVEQRAAATNDNDIVKFTTELQQTNDSIRDNREALDRLANSSELASKALGEVNKIRDLQRNRSELVNKLLTQTPEEAKKLNDTFIRLQNNLRGGLNTGANSRAAREAFSQALRSGSSLQGAYRAGNTVLAQQRQETLAMFQDPNIRGANKLQMKNQGYNDEQIENILNQQEAMLKRQMAIETGQINNPMVQADIIATQNRQYDPAMKQAADQYTAITGRQADANTEGGRLALVQSLLVDSNKELKKALDGLRDEIKNARGFDAKVEGGKLGAAAVASGKGAFFEGVSPAGGRAPGTMYASTGALVNFEPKGTDTVPAMLTPGEFVINRESTQQYLPLLQAINKSKGGVVYLEEGGLLSNIAEYARGFGAENAVRTGDTIKSAVKGGVSLGNLAAAGGASPELRFAGDVADIGLGTGQAMYKASHLGKLAAATAGGAAAVSAYGIYGVQSSLIHGVSLASGETNLSDYEAANREQSDQSYLTSVGQNLYDPGKAGIQTGLSINSLLNPDSKENQQATKTRENITTQQQILKLAERDGTNPSAGIATVNFSKGGMVYLAAGGKADKDKEVSVDQFMQEMDRQPQPLSKDAAKQVNDALGAQAKIVEQITGGRSLAIQSGTFDPGKGTAQERRFAIANSMTVEEVKFARQQQALSRMAPEKKQKEVDKLLRDGKLLSPSQLQAESLKLNAMQQAASETARVNYFETDLASRGEVGKKEFDARGGKMPIRSSSELAGVITDISKQDAQTFFDRTAIAVSTPASSMKKPEDRSGSPSGSSDKNRMRALSGISPEDRKTIGIGVLKESKEEEYQRLRDNFFAGNKKAADGFIKNEERNAKLAESREKRDKGLMSSFEKQRDSDPSLRWADFADNNKLSGKERDRFEQSVAAADSAKSQAAVDAYVKEQAEKSQRDFDTAYKSTDEYKASAAETAKLTAAAEQSKIRADKAQASYDKLVREQEDENRKRVEAKEKQQRISANTQKTKDDQALALAGGVSPADYKPDFVDPDTGEIKKGDQTLREKIRAHWETIAERKVNNRELSPSEGDAYVNKKASMEEDKRIREADQLVDDMRSGRREASEAAQIAKLRDMGIRSESMPATPALGSVASGSIPTPAEAKAAAQARASADSRFADADNYRKGKQQFQNNMKRLEQTERAALQAKADVEKTEKESGIFGSIGRGLDQFGRELRVIGGADPSTLKDQGKQFKEKYTAEAEAARKTRERFQYVDPNRPSPEAIVLLDKQRTEATKYDSSYGKIAQEQEKSYDFAADTATNIAITAATLPIGGGAATLGKAIVGGFAEGAITEGGLAASRAYVGSETRSGSQIARDILVSGTIGGISAGVISGGSQLARRGAQTADTAVSAGQTAVKSTPSQAIAPTPPVAPVVTPPIKPPVSAPTSPRKSSFIDFINKKASDLYGGITGKTAQARRAALAATEKALDLVEYSDDAKKYMSTLSKEQLDSFRQLARNGTSTEKQAKLMKDSIESAAKDNLKFIEGDDYLAYQQELIDLKVLTAGQVKDRMKRVGGSYSSLPGRKQPQISINPKMDPTLPMNSTTRVHELTHYMDDVSGHLSPGRGNYGALQKQVGPVLDQFLDSSQYEAIVDGLGSAYTGERIRTLPQELITVLTEGKANKATSHLFKEGSTAQEILNTLWQARGYNNGGIVYAANGALMSAMSKGSDSVPAMLTPGEFVMNRESTQEHLPLLKAINSGNYEQGGLIKYMAQGGVVTPQYRDVGGAIGSLAGSSITGAGLDMGAISELAKELPKLKEAFGSFEKLSDFTQSFEKLTQNMGSNLTGFAETVSNMPKQMEHSMKAVVNGTINSNIPGATTQIVNSRHEAQIVYDQNTQRLDRASEGAFSRSDPAIMRGTSGAGGAGTRA